MENKPDKFDRLFAQCRASVKRFAIHQPLAFAAIVVALLYLATVLLDFPSVGLRSWLFWTCVTIGVAKLYYRFLHPHFKAEWQKNVEKGRKQKQDKEVNSSNAAPELAIADQELEMDVEPETIPPPGEESDSTKAPEKASEKSGNGCLPFGSFFWVIMALGFWGNMARQQQREDERTSRYRGLSSRPYGNVRGLGDSRSFDMRNAAQGTASDAYWKANVASRHESRFDYTPNPNLSASAAAEESGTLLVLSSTVVPSRTPASVDNDLKSMVRRHAARERAMGQNILNLIRLMKANGINEHGIKSVESSDIADAVLNLFAAEPDAAPVWARKPIQQYLDDLEWTVKQYDEIIAMQAMLRERYQSSRLKRSGQFELPNIDD